MKKSKISSIGSASNAEINLHNQAGAGRRGRGQAINEVLQAFETFELKNSLRNSFLRDSALTDETARADYLTCTKLAWNINNKLTERGHFPLVTNGQLNEQLRDCIQAGMLALQLHRQDKIARWDDSGNVKIETNFNSKKRSLRAVASNAMWAAFKHDQRNTVAYDFDKFSGHFGDGSGEAIKATNGEKAKEVFRFATDWQSWANDKESDNSETTEERKARLLAKLPAVIQAIIDRPTKCRGKRHEYQRAVFAEKLRAFVFGLLTDGNPETVALAAGFKPSPGQTVFSAIAHALKKAGFKVARRVPVHIGAKRRPGGSAAAAMVAA